MKRLNVIELKTNSESLIKMDSLSQIVNIFPFIQHRD